MSYSHTASFGSTPSLVGRALRRLGAELGALSDALLHPGALQREVETFGALLARARQVAGDDPARAARLRAQAARLLA